VHLWYSRNGKKLRLEHALRPAVFLDLNGTLVLPVQAESPWEYRAIPGSVEAVARLGEAGFVCPVVTVQSRIGKGMYSKQEFRSWFDEFSHQAAQNSAFFAGVYLCPHRFHSGCACGKPNSLLYESAARDHHIDVRRSLVVGDSVDDLSAGWMMGMRTCLVLTGWGEAARDRVPRDPDHISADLSQAVDWIVTC
jgi:D-glycero-D-manno-heptose 1,7-bisphosphate phosphatase